MTGDTWFHVAGKEAEAEGYELEQSTGWAVEEGYVCVRGVVSRAKDSGVNESHVGSLVGKEP